jgi:hypothetical protein
MLKKIDIPLLLLGTLILLFGVSVSLIEVMASEAAINGQNYVTYHPFLAILVQPVQFVTNTLPNTNILAVIVAWGVELAFITFALGYEIAHKSLRHRNPKAAEWFELGVWCCIAVDYGTNVIYGGGIASQIGFIGAFLLRLGIAALVCGFAMLFPIIGWSFIVEAFDGGHASRLPAPAGRSLSTTTMPVPQHKGN